MSNSGRQRERERARERNPAVKALKPSLVRILLNSGITILFFCLVEREGLHPASYSIQAGKPTYDN